MPGRSWDVGIQMRSRGTVQSDRWRGQLSSLAGDKLIAIIPVLGWWEQRRELRTLEMRFSLVVSVFGPGVYDAIKPRVEAAAQIPIETWRGRPPGARFRCSAVRAEEAKMKSAGRVGRSGEYGRDELLGAAVERGGVERSVRDRVGEQGDLLSSDRSPRCPRSERAGQGAPRTIA